ncbi:MAG: START domain-containing protein [Bacteroidales bacterium]|nr:START domain-containing protein [Bacteroidales bacterium]
MKRIYTLIFASYLLLSYSYAQEEIWELKKEDEGIKVYLMDIEGSNTKAYKAEALVESKLSAIVAVLKDVQNHDRLFTDNIENELLETSDTFQVYYAVTDIPWPLADRDGVYSYRFRQDYYSKDVKVIIQSEPGFVPEKKGLVRVEKAEGYWLLEPVDYNKVLVTFQMHAESGGNIPSWLVNMFLVDSPMKYIKNLRERVTLDRYKSQKFGFLVEY